MIRCRNVVLVLLLAVAACAGLRVALAGYGTVQLGTDARPDYQRPANRQTLSSDYGFNYFNKNGTGPDTCATLGTNGDGSNLIAKEAYAFPENADIIRPTFFGTNVVQIDGRTGECLYDIRGCYSGGTVPAGGVPGKNWESELDSNQQPHFIVYIDEKYCDDDNQVYTGSSVTVTVELVNPNGNCYDGILTFQSDDGASLLFMDGPGSTFEEQSVAFSLSGTDSRFTTVIYGCMPGTAAIKASANSSQCPTQGEVVIRIDGNSWKSPWYGI